MRTAYFTTDPHARTGEPVTSTWGLSSSFETTSPRYRLAVVVSQYAELLCQCSWARGTIMRQLMVYTALVAIDFFSGQ